MYCSSVWKLHTAWIRHSLTFFLPEDVIITCVTGVVFNLGDVVADLKHLLAEFCNCPSFFLFFTTGNRVEFLTCGTCAVHTNGVDRDQVEKCRSIPFNCLMLRISHNLCVRVHWGCRGFSEGKGGVRCKCSLCAEFACILFVCQWGFLPPAMPRKAFIITFLLSSPCRCYLFLHLWN